MKRFRSTLPERAGSQMVHRARRIAREPSETFAPQPPKFPTRMYTPHEVILEERWRKLRDAELNAMFAAWLAENPSYEDYLERAAADFAAEVIGG